MRRLFVYGLVFKVTVCAIMWSVLLFYWVFASITFGAAPRYWIPVVLLSPGIAVSLLLRTQALKGTEKRWSFWLFGIESIYTLLVGFAYFEEPMHDMALGLLGHHGRFGVTDLDGGGSPYLINDVTLPLILFLPPLIVGIAYFVRQRFMREH